MGSAADTHPSAMDPAPPTTGAHGPPRRAHVEPADLPTIVRENAAFVWRTLRYCGVRTSDLDDACQEVFMVALRRLPDFEGRSSLQTWLYGICTRVASAHHRRAFRRKEALTDQPPELGVEPTVAEQLDEERAREHLRQVLDRLDPARRQVFVLYEIENRPMAEIAEILGCPLRTAYSRLEAARKEVLSSWRRLSSSSGRMHARR